MLAAFNVNVMGISSTDMGRMDRYEQDDSWGCTFWQYNSALWSFDGPLAHLV